MKKCKHQLLLCPSSSTINIQQHQESWFRTVECGGGVCRQLMRICQMPAASKFHKTTTTQSPFPVWPGSDFFFWRPGKGFHIKSIVATTSSHQQSPWIFWYSNLEGVAFFAEIIILIMVSIPFISWSQKRKSLEKYKKEGGSTKLLSGPITTFQLMMTTMMMIIRKIGTLVRTN